jgi:hypothetical protein
MPLIRCFFFVLLLSLDKHDLDDEQDTVATLRKKIKEGEARSEAALSKLDQEIANHKLREKQHCKMLKEQEEQLSKLAGQFELETRSQSQKVDDLEAQVLKLKVETQQQRRKILETKQQLTTDNVANGSGDRQGRSGRDLALLFPTTSADARATQSAILQQSLFGSQHAASTPPSASEGKGEGEGGDSHHSAMLLQLRSKIERQDMHIATLHDQAHEFEKIRASLAHELTSESEKRLLSEKRMHRLEEEVRVLRTIGDEVRQLKTQLQEATDAVSDMEEMKSMYQAQIASFLESHVSSTQNASMPSLLQPTSPLASTTQEASTPEERCAEHEADSTAPNTMGEDASGEKKDDKDSTSDIAKDGVEYSVGVMVFNQNLLQTPAVVNAMTTTNMIAADVDVEGGSKGNNFTMDDSTWEDPSGMIMEGLEIADSPHKTQQALPNTAHENSGEDVVCSVSSAKGDDPSPVSSTPTPPTKAELNDMRLKRLERFQTPIASKLEYGDGSNPAVGRPESPKVVVESAGVAVKHARTNSAMDNIHDREMRSVDHTSEVEKTSSAGAIACVDTAILEVAQEYDPQSSTAQRQEEVAAKYGEDEPPDVREHRSKNKNGLIPTDDAVENCDELSQLKMADLQVEVEDGGFCGAQDGDCWPTASDIEDMVDLDLSGNGSVEAARDEETSTTITRFEVTFSDRRLGMWLSDTVDGTGVQVSAFVKDESNVPAQAEVCGLVEIGDLVVGVNGTNTYPMNNRAVLDMIIRAPRPITIQFERLEGRKGSMSGTTEEGVDLSRSEEESAEGVAPEEGDRDRASAVDQGCILS